MSCKAQLSTRVKMRVRVERRQEVHCFQPLFSSENPFFFPTPCNFCSGLSRSVSPNPDSNCGLHMTLQTRPRGKTDLKRNLLVALNFPEQPFTVQVQLWAQKAQKLQTLQRLCLKAESSALRNLSLARSFSDTLK